MGEKKKWFIIQLVKSDEIEVGGYGMKAVARTNSSPAFPLCILLIIVAVWSVLFHISWPFIIIASAVAVVFVYLLIFKPQNLMDSKTLFEWTKTFFGDKDKPMSIEEGAIVKTETKTISAKASIIKRK